MASGGSTITSTSSGHSGSMPYEEFLDPGEENEELDPGVKYELESLNQSASDVNRLEKEIDAAREKYQLTFTEISQQLEQTKKKIHDFIKKARPYYELKESAKNVQSEALRSARKFQSANGVYLAAKETISLAELRLMDDKAASLSAAWQEMLNHALLRVTEAEQDKSRTEEAHLKMAANFAQMEIKLHTLEKKYKKSISKARVYFETKKELEIKLQQLKQTLEDLQQAMQSAKRRYSVSLHQLESISNGIHEKRRHRLMLMLPREPGVGAEKNEQLTDRACLPSLTSSCNDDILTHFYDVDDVCYQLDNMDEIDEEFLAYEDIQNESVLRAKVLTMSLEDDDTSFTNRSAFRERKKRLLRAQSLPMNIDIKSKNSMEYTFHQSTDLSDAFGYGKASKETGSFLKSEESLNPDRYENSPPDGDSLSNEEQYVWDSDEVQQESIQNRDGFNLIRNASPDCLGWELNADNKECTNSQHSVMHCNTDMCHTQGKNEPESTRKYLSEGEGSVDSGQLTGNTCTVLKNVCCDDDDAAEN